MAKLNLTVNQDEVYRCIRRHIRDHGVSPSYKEIGRAAGCSPAAVVKAVKKLVKEGQLRHIGRKARSLAVVAPPAPIAELKKIAAGRPAQLGPAEALALLDALGASGVPTEPADPI